jgi:hypothetical protein
MSGMERDGVGRTGKERWEELSRREEWGRVRMRWGVGWSGLELERLGMGTRGRVGCSGLELEILGIGTRGRVGQSGLELESPRIGTMGRVGRSGRSVEDAPPPPLQVTECVAYGSPKAAPPLSSEYGIKPEPASVFHLYAYVSSIPAPIHSQTAQLVKYSTYSTRDQRRLNSKRAPKILPLCPFGSKGKFFAALK